MLLENNLLQYCGDLIVCWKLVLAGFCVTQLTNLRLYELLTNEQSCIVMQQTSYPRIALHWNATHQLLINFRLCKPAAL